jgi:AraC-like DNA-binding protein
MEIVVAIIFVQSFIWATLLLRKPSKTGSPVVSFLSLFLIYLLFYINTVFGKYIPGTLIPACTLILAISISYYQTKNLHLRLSLAGLALLGILSVLSVLLLVYSFRNGRESEFYWRGIALIGIVSLVYDTCLFIRHLKKKTIPGSLLKDFRFKMSLMFLVDKILVLLFASIILLFSARYEDSQDTLRIIFHFLVAILSFITGYLAVTASFHIEVQQKKKYRRNMSDQDNTALIEKLTGLMQEQKPFLDCELTLEKMSRMLVISEHELTSLLNHEMDTSFYKLVNDYRMETVMKKLKTSDHGRFTIMASAYESGFNSKSTFYRIFKEYTGMTPGEFLEKD